MDRRGFVGSFIAGVFGVLGTSQAKEDKAKKKEIYNPLHNIIQWQIPTKRRDVWTWAEYFYETDPEVNQLVNIQQELILKPYQKNSENRQLVKDLCVLGNSFWSNFEFMSWIDPYYVDIENGIITVNADEKLKRTVWSKQPTELYNKIPKEVRKMILGGKAMPLNCNQYSIHKNQSGFGCPRWYSYFKYLVCKQRIMERTYAPNIISNEEFNIYRMEIEKGNPIALETELMLQAYKNETYPNPVIYSEVIEARKQVESFQRRNTHG